VLEAVRNGGNCLVGPIHLLACVCCCWLHCHLWVELVAEVGEVFGFVEWQWGEGVVKGELGCQPEV